MTEAPVSYVERTPEGAWRVVGTRVGLDSVILAYREGRGAEGIADLYPSLTLEQVFGTIAFYLRHRDELDAYLIAQDERWRALRDASERDNADILPRLRSEAPAGCL
jgi:uncharacterized protein (DUF433 family)